MIGLTIRHLRYFEALARHQHFGRAAADCAVSQPALSIQIKDLEKIVGAPLIERTARKTTLTPLGTVFLEKSRDVLKSFDDLGEVARAEKNSFEGVLKLGVIPTIAPYLLPKLMGFSAARFPGLELHPKEAVTQDIIAGLLESKIDAAIVALPVSEPSLEELKLFDEKFVLVRPMAQANHPIPDMQALQTMRLLLLEEGHCFRDQALSFCELSGREPKDVLEGSSLSTIVQMVGVGIGVTLIPEMAVPFETRLANVTTSTFPAPGPSRSVGMIWRKTSPLSDHLVQFGVAVRAAGAA